MISLDRLRGELDVDPDDAQSEVIAAAREQARRYLRAGTSFAWNATNLTTSLRGQLLELFRGYRARTHIVYCEAGPEDLLTRNRSREARVPAWVIDRMIERWTVPDPAGGACGDLRNPVGTGRRDVASHPASLTASQAAKICLSGGSTSRDHSGT